MKNLVIKTAYETIKEALGWAVDSTENSEDFSNYVLGITEVTDAICKEIDEMPVEKEE